MTGAAEDRLSIRELLDSFAAAVMHNDTELWASTWADQGRWQTPVDPVAIIGRARIVASFKEKMAYVKFMTLISFPAGLRIDNENASGRALCQELIVPKIGAPKMVSGIYHDEYIKQTGRWYFQSRTYDVFGAC